MVEDGRYKAGVPQTSHQRFLPRSRVSMGEIELIHIEKLEVFLRFFHGSCKDIVQTLPPQSRIKFWGNVDIVAAGAFFNLCKDFKQKIGQHKIHKALLDATAKYLEPLGLQNDAVRLERLLGRPTLVCFAKDV